MTATQIIEIAREKLPYTSDFEMPVIRIPVQNENQFSVEMMMLVIDAPTIYDIPYYIVEFRKQIIKGVVVGWEFVDIVR